MSVNMDKVIESLNLEPNKQYVVVGNELFFENNEKINWIFTEGCSLCGTIMDFSFGKIENTEIYIMSTHKVSPSEGLKVADASPQFKVIKYRFV